MSYLNLVDPDVRDIVAQFPPLLPTTETQPALREAVIGLYPPTEVPFEEHYILGLNGAPDVRVLIHRLSVRHWWGWIRARQSRFRRCMTPHNSKR